MYYWLVVAATGIGGFLAGQRSKGVGRGILKSSVRGVLVVQREMRRIVDEARESMSDIVAEAQAETVRKAEAKN